ncbi:MAG TPA: DNA topoisomerase IB [Candidatus Dormibacteraeota bacterium]|nr:DNA topoisomerase IB [Candidatus Dormibacteraeota bacterium]
MSRRRRPVDNDAAVSARAAGLRYVSDASPGIRREARPGGGFRYIGTDGRAIRRAAELQRIAHLAVPPAWTDVWICPHANGHIQATGRDARRRKQYRYHDRWREARDATKYERTLAFGEALPRIRAQVDRDLRRPDLSRERVLALVVRLLDATYIRVGNEEYARENRSFGLTTMRERHVEVEGSKVRFQFRGKSGRAHVVDLRDARVARAITRLEELPGQVLFQWLDEDDDVHGVESDDVNAYIRDAAGDDFTAKDFRTWAGTVLAAWALQELGEHASKAQAKRQVVDAVGSVARHLGNTSAVCRRCYVHPEVISAHLDGELLNNIGQRAEETLAGALDDLSPAEAAVLAFLRRRIAPA